MISNFKTLVFTHLMFFSRRRIIIFAVITVLLAVLVSVSRSFYQTVKLTLDQKKIDQEIARLKDEQISLNNSLQNKGSDQYVEEVARDKLLMSKPGEKVVILPQDNNRLSGSLSSGRSTGEVSVVSLPNPQKWFYLFFK